MSSSADETLQWGKTTTSSTEMTVPNDEKTKVVPMTNEDEDLVDVPKNKLVKFQVGIDPSKDDVSDEKSK